MHEKKQILTIGKPTTDNNDSFLHIEFDTEYPYPVGGKEGLKSWLEVRPKDHWLLRFVRKSLNSESYKDLNKVREMCLVYRILYKKGYPVPPTVRYTTITNPMTGESQHQMVMSDMTENGQYVLWGINDNRSDFDQHQLEKLDLHNNDLSEIRKQMEVLVDKANDDHVRLEWHNFQIRRHLKTKKIQVILLDLHEMTIPEQWSNRVEIQNKLAIKTFFQDLEWFLNNPENFSP